jgi:hypothetical protein
VYAAGWGVLADLAAQYDAALAETLRARAKSATAAILSKCWDGARGRFVSLYKNAQLQDTVAAVEAVQSLFPLLLPDLPAPIAAALVTHLTNSSKFWLPFPVPSVSADTVRRLFLFALSGVFALHRVVVSNLF